MLEPSKCFLMTVNPSNMMAHCNTKRMPWQPFPSSNLRTFRARRQSCYPSMSGADGSAITSFFGAAEGGGQDAKAKGWKRSAPPPEERETKLYPSQTAAAKDRSMHQPAITHPS